MILDDVRITMMIDPDNEEEQSNGYVELTVSGSDVKEVAKGAKKLLKKLGLEEDK